MTTTEQFLSEALPPQRPEPARDGWGRYKIPDPETGEIKAWTRATTFASTVMDERRFDSWKTNLTAIGLAQRPDLVAKIHNIHDYESDEGKELLAGWIKEAQDRGGTHTKANVGTALHEYLAAMDEGYSVTVPDHWKNDVDSYLTRICEADITVSKNYVERICIVPELGVAGTMDRLARFASGLPFILDVKTASEKNLRKALPEIAIQLTLYAHATHCWDPVDGQLHAMPEVNKDIAVVAHVPAGEGNATLLYVPIKEAWEMTSMCAAVRNWRTRKNLAYPVIAKESA